MSAKLVGRDGRILQVDSGLLRAVLPGDENGCKCCAFECAEEVTIEMSFCGMSLTAVMPIPGFLNSFDSTVTLPDGSYLIPTASIGCTPCGWSLSVEVCAYCVETNQFAGEGYTANIPFSEEETQTGGFCPESGPVPLVCFSEQFGIPCVVPVSVVIE